MPLEPLYESLDHDLYIDHERRQISTIADRMSRISVCLVDFAEIRQDDLAQQTRQALAGLMGDLNRAFTRLGKLLSERPQKAAAAHFTNVGTPSQKMEEAAHHRRLDEDAEADADAAAAR